MEYVTQVQRVNAAAGTNALVCFAPSGIISGEVWKVNKISLIPNAAIATDGTDYVTVRAYKGASTALTAARTTNSSGGAAFTQYTPEDQALTATGADLEISSAVTGILSVRVTNSGSGKLHDFSVVASFERIR